VSQPIEAFRNAFKIPELKRRLIFTLFMLAVCRLGAHVPTPGIDGRALAEMMSRMQGGLLGFYDLFSGGALQNATVFALGIMPYISASIIMSLLVTVVPALERIQKEGAEGQKKITEYTRYGTIVLCIVQAIGIAIMLEGFNRESSAQIVANPGWGFRLMCIISFTTGTAFLMWVGEQISENGIGNGISLIIFVNIVSRMPRALGDTLRLMGEDQLNIAQVGLLIVLMVLVIAGAILVTTGQRRIPVQYPRQIKGRKSYGGQRNYLPLRVNQAGVIPIIFASSLMMLPNMISRAVNIEAVQTFFGYWFGYNGPLYLVCDAALIFFFAFFYTAITFNPVELADNMKKYGGVITGIRPGKATADYLQKVMTRITTVGGLFLVVVAIFPALVYKVLDIPSQSITSFFGGTSLLILVGVALDTARQIEQHLLMHHYDGFSKGRRIRSRRG